MYRFYIGPLRDTTGNMAIRTYAPLAEAYGISLLMRWLKDKSDF
jgi:hypothetical protein